MKRFLTGWSLWWRSHLLPIAIALTLKGPDDVSSPVLLIAIGAMILLVHWAGKNILQRQFHQQVSGFVGWSIFWRSATCLAGWLIVIVCLNYFTVWVFRRYELGDDPGFLGLACVALFLWADINSLGWAIDQTRFKLGRPVLRA